MYCYIDPGNLKYISIYQNADTPYPVAYTVQSVEYAVGNELIDITIRNFGITLIFY